MNPTGSLRVLSLAVSFLIAIAAPSTWAASGENEIIDDRWLLNLGGFLTDFTTDASVGSGGVFGTIVRLEDDLGVENDQNIFRLDGFTRINERNAIGFGFWTLNRDGRAVLVDQLEFDGNLFDVGALIESEFDTSWFRVDWRRSLLRTDKGEAGFTIGLSAYDFDLGVEGLALVDDGMGGVIEEFVRAEDDLIAPAPTIGMFVNYAIKPKFWFRTAANFLDASVSDVEVNIVDTTFLLDWYFSRHVGIGAGYNITKIEVRDSGDDPFLVDYRQSGILGYLSLTF